MSNKSPVQYPLGFLVFISVLGLAAAIFSTQLNSIKKKALDDYKEEYLHTVYRSENLYPNLVIEERRATEKEKAVCYLYHAHLGYLAKWNECKTGEYVLLACKDHRDLATCSDEVKEQPKVK